MERIQAGQRSYKAQERVVALNEGDWEQLLALMLNVPLSHCLFTCAPCSSPVEWT